MQKLKRSKSSTPNLNFELIQQTSDARIIPQTQKRQSFRQENETQLLASKINQLKLKEIQSWQSIEKIRKKVDNTTKVKSKNQQIKESLMSLKRDIIQKEKLRIKDINQNLKIQRNKTLQSKIRVESNLNDQRNQDQFFNDQPIQKNKSLVQKSKVRGVSDLLKFRKQQEHSKLTKQAQDFQNKILKEKQKKNQAQENIKQMQLEELQLLQKLQVTMKLLKQAQNDPNYIQFLEQKAKEQAQSFDTSEIFIPQSQQNLIWDQNPQNAAD